MDAYAKKVRIIVRSLRRKHPRVVPAMDIDSSGVTISLSEKSFDSNFINLLVRKGACKINERTVRFNRGDK